MKKRSRSETDSDSESNEAKKIIKKSKQLFRFDKYSGDVYSRGNHITFKGDVNKDNVYQLGEEISKLNRDFRELKRNLESVNITPKPIYLHINSYGGYLDDAWTAVDFIKGSKIPIHTIVEGRVASSASLMSIVGERRYMTKHSRILIHQLSGGMWGKMEELEDAIKDCKEAMRDITKLYLEHTNMTRNEIREQLKRDRWWSFNQCRQRGLIDQEWKNNI